MLTGAAVLAVGAAGSSGKPTVSASDNAALGKILVGATGRTVYHYLGDHGARIACAGTCAAQWPPVLIPKTAKPVAGPGLQASKLGTVTRPDGTVQVTYNGYALYRFSGDSRNGQVNGQGLDKRWYAVAPSGAVVKVASSAGAATGGGTSTPTSSGGGSSSGGGYDYGY